jgi:hypothetical protein
MSLDTRQEGIEPGLCLVGRRAVYVGPEDKGVCKWNKGHTIHMLAT